jgi:hypothetical protein
MAGLVRWRMDFAELDEKDIPQKRPKAKALDYQPHFRVGVNAKG